MTMAGPLVQGDKHGRRPVVNACLSGSAMNTKTISICRPIVSKHIFGTLQMNTQNMKPIHFVVHIYFGAERDSKVCTHSNGNFWLSVGLGRKVVTPGWEVEGSLTHQQQLC